MTLPSIPVDLYPWFALVSSVGILALFAAHTADAAARYRTHHDDRAAVELLIALTLAVVGVGLTISASASFIDALGITGRSEMRNVGLGVVRGALLVTAMVLFLIDRRERGWGRWHRDAR